MELWYGRWLEEMKEKVSHALVQILLFTAPYMPRLARTKTYNGAVAFLQF